MAEIVEFLAEEQLQIGQVTKVDKKRLTVSDERDRPQKVSPDKVLFRHSGALSAVREQLEALQQDVDVELLWEALLAEETQGAQEAPALARLFFDEDDALHASAVFRALAREKLHFRRRGKAFEARTGEELERLQRQRQAEARAAAELDGLRAALGRAGIDDELAGRLRAVVQGRIDRPLQTVLAERAKDPALHAFNMLISAGRVALTEDREVVQAGLKREHPPAVVEAAALATCDPPATDSGAGPICSGSFSIDDPETREVDDVLSVHEEAELLRVDIDIADAARLVRAGDPVDREALGRATSVYLPTGTYYMVPDVIGADRASLHAGEVRPTLRTSVWINNDGTIERFELRRCWIEVERRLDYDTADRLIAEGAADDPTARALRRLDELARKLGERRKQRGAFSVRRLEWKIRVSDDGSEISATPIPGASPSRALVAEMMILANGLAAELAVRERIPLIFRVQAAPDAPLPEIDPDDPAAFARLRGLIAAAKLSVHPSAHFALGLEAYSQVTSPLRRYADLVQQRQLAAHLAGEPPPYSAEDLLPVLATVEAAAQEAKKIEFAVTLRWALELVSRGQRQGQRGWIVGDVPTGYKVQLASCGAVGLLPCRQKKQHELGQEVVVDVEEIKPRRGIMRLRFA